MSLLLCPAPFCKTRVKPFGDLRALTCHVVKSCLCAAWITKNTRQVLFDDDDDDMTDTFESEPHQIILNDDNLNTTDNFATIPTSESHEHLPKSNLPTRYFVHPFCEGGRTFGTGNSPYQLAKSREVDHENITYPFAGIEEWGLASWLAKAGLSQNKIDAFLRLDWVQARDEFAPSFKSAKDLLRRIESLPGAPSWSFQLVTLPEAPRDPQLLLYRDPVECLAWLEANPEFSQEKDYLPYEEYLDDARTDRVYCEIASGLAWNEWQRECPEGITILPYILASDSTHLTNFTGDKKIKPIIISNGHIRQHVRAAPSRQAFLCLAYFPEAKFTNVQFETTGQYQRYPGYLRNRLYHECMRIVMNKLQFYSHIPIPMVDSEGFVRKELLRLVTYIGDLPEQTLIACLTTNNCVPCNAKTADFGSSQPCTPRIASDILDRIRAVRHSIGGKEADVSTFGDTWKFAEACRKEGLNGVEHPWWADFEGLDICRVIGPDILHGLHKAFKDHHAAWICNLMGKVDLDHAFMEQPKSVGFRHFSMGLSKLSQFSGKEHRDMQRYMLAAIADHSNIPGTALRATRAELDFIYTAQYNAHTDGTLEQLEKYNKVFHGTKDIFIRTGARRGKNDVIEHFNIPKLHTRHHYTEFVKCIGGAANFSTEAPESYHRDFAKEPFEATSAHEYPKQMARFLDWQEKLCFFNRYLAWCLGRQTPLDFEDTSGEADSEHVVMDEVHIALTVYEPRLSIKPHLSQCSIDNILELFHIDPPTFFSAVQRYEATLDLSARQQRSHGRGWFYESLDSLPMHYNSVDVWMLFRLQLPLVDELHDRPVIRLVRAQPAQEDKPGVFDVVFVDKDPEGIEEQVGIRNFLIGQLRLIFRPLNPDHKERHNPALRYASPCLAFIELFDRLPLDPDTQMYPVKKARGTDGTRKCDIVILEQVVQPCPLSPRYETTPTTLRDMGIDAFNCIDLLEEFWINCFFSKETYQTVF